LNKLKLNNKIDFFLVGAARCGTTSLYNYLNNCEDVFLPKVKEPNFFSNVDSPKSEDFELPKPDKSYHSKIINSKEIYDSLYQDAAINQLKGDTSPSYLWDRKVAKKLYDHNPHAKIIISLRHPVERAYSHYIMNYYTGADSNKSFQEALNDQKIEMWGTCNQYLEMSAYFHQVNAYYEIFPKSQIKILIYEDWTKDVRMKVNEVFEFLGLKPCESIYNGNIESNKIKPVKKMFLLNFLRQNNIKSTIKNIISQDNIDSLKNYIFSDDKEIKKIDEGLRDRLSQSFIEDINRLSQLTGIDFSHKWE
jgi:hypothetical protein